MLAAIASSNVNVLRYWLSAQELSRRKTVFRGMPSLTHPISRLRDFTRSSDKIYYMISKRPGQVSTRWVQTHEKDNERVRHGIDWRRISSGFLSYGIYCKDYTKYVNSSPREQNGRHFAEDIFRCIFVNEKFGISISNLFLKDQLTISQHGFR